MNFDPQAVRAFEHAGWQRAAPRYAGSFAGATSRFTAALLDAAAVTTESPVLDICCGTGLAAAAAGSRGATAVGLDFSPAMMTTGRAQHAGVAFTGGDAEQLPFADRTFAAVVSNFGIHHVPNPVAALAEARRVLRPGSRLAFTVWAEPSENIAWKIMFTAIERHGDLSAAKTPAPGGKLNRADQCRNALAQAGFGQIGCELVRRVWRLEKPEHLIDFLASGTVRTAALIGAQQPEPLAAIKADAARQAEAYRQGDHVEVPIAAVLAWGTKVY